MNERRRSHRRQLPFVRSGVVEVGGSHHIVSVTDIGPEGAFLTTRLDLPLGERLVLRMILPRASRPIPLPSQVVWRSDTRADGRQRGLAVRFRGLNAGVIRCLEEFAAESPITPVKRSGERFEYRIVETSALDVGELNRLGLEGWRLASTAASLKGLSLVFLRRA